MLQWYNVLLKALVRNVVLHCLTDSYPLWFDHKGDAYSSSELSLVSLSLSFESKYTDLHDVLLISLIGKLLDNFIERWPLVKGCLVSVCSVPFVDRLLYFLSNSTYLAVFERFICWIYCFSLFLLSTDLIGRRLTFLNWIGTFFGKNLFSSTCWAIHSLISSICNNVLNSVSFVSRSKARLL